MYIKIFFLTLTMLTGSLQALEARWLAEEESKVVAYNTVDLATHCLLKLIKDKDCLVKVLKIAPSEILSKLLPLMEAEARALVKTYLKRRILTPQEFDEKVQRYLVKYLQEVVDSKDIPLAQACLLCSVQSQLDSSALRDPLYKAVAENKYLSELMIDMLAQLLKADEITKKTFPELAALYGGNHPQRAALTQAFIKQHIKEIKPHSGCWNCFRTSSYQTSTQLPSTDFFDNPLRAIYNDYLTSASIYRDTQKLYTLDTRAGGGRNPTGSEPATMSADGRLLALCTTQSIDIYLLPQAGTDPEVCNTSKEQVFSIKLPEEYYNNILHIAFSNDNSCLRVDHAIYDEAIYFDLPSYYLQFSMTFEQVLFLRLLNLLYESQAIKYVSASYALHKPNIIESFPVNDARLFRQELRSLLAAGRNSRADSLRSANENFVSALHDYFYPAELRLLKNDLGEITSPRLQKKITKKMVTSLKEAYPTKDFSSLLNIREGSEIADIKINIQVAWDEYQTLQDSQRRPQDYMKPEEFKAHFITLMTESYNRFKKYQ